MPAIHPVEFHPIIVHFPIALLVLSVIFDFLGVFLRRWGLTTAATWMLLFGTPSAGFRAALWLAERALCRHLSRRGRGYPALAQSRRRAHDEPL